MEHFFCCNATIGGICVTENSIARVDGRWKFSRASMGKYLSSTPRQGNHFHPNMSCDFRPQYHRLRRNLEILHRRRQGYKLQACKEVDYR